MFMDCMATSTENPNNSLKVHWRDGGSFTKVSGEKINTETFIIFVNAKKGHLVAQTKNTMQYRAVPKNEIFGYTYKFMAAPAACGSSQARGSKWSYS